MPDRDGYIAGVPCWIDTTQPDPDAAAEFYGALFGWELEDAMPPDSPGKYFMARIRGRDVAAISSQMERGRRRAWNTYIQVDSADDAAAKVATAGGTVVSEPFDVFDSGRMAVFADPQGAAFSRLAAQPAPRLAGRQRARQRSTSTTSHTDRRRGREGVLRRGVRLGPARHGRRRRHLDAARRTATTSRSSTRAPRERLGEMGAPDGFIDAVASVRPADGGAPALGRDVRASTTPTRSPRRRTSSAATVLAGAGRRAVGADERDRRPAGRDVHREPVHAREQGPHAGRTAASSAPLGASVSRSTTTSSGRPRPL